MPRPRKTDYTIEDLAREADVAARTVERWLEAGLCPQPDDRVERPGGLPQRVWRPATVASFLAMVKIAKRERRSLKSVFKEHAQKRTVGLSE